MHDKNNFFSHFRALDGTNPFSFLFFTLLYFSFLFFYQTDIAAGGGGAHLGRLPVRGRNVPHVRGPRHPQAVRAQVGI